MPGVPRANRPRSQGRAFPDWLAAHLEARGDVPRNNIVDATNYVLHELGHPVHAFDLDKLEGGEINIRYAQTGETMLPLGADAKEIELSAEDLVIADAAKPIALAGVKSGATSSVDENTTNLLLETATFTPSAVRDPAAGMALPVTLRTDLNVKSPTDRSLLPPNVSCS